MIFLEGFSKIINFYKQLDKYHSTKSLIMIKTKFNLLIIIFFIILINGDIFAKENNNKEVIEPISSTDKKISGSLELNYLKENKKKENINDEYEGPQVTTEDIEIIYTEDAKLKARIYAKEAQQFKNKNAMYPKGIFVEFYDKEEKISGTLKSDYVKYDSKKNIYIIKGNVVVKNKKKDETLKTTEITWVPEDEKIFSKDETFVEIQTKDVNLIGKGIDASQDLSRYKIKDLKGTIKIRKKENKIKEISELGYRANG